MVEYISREALIAAAREYDLGGSYDNTELAVPVSFIRSLPAADVVERASGIIGVTPTIDLRPVVRGAWRGIGKTGRIFVCSTCDKTFPYKTNYCPNCGARMEES